MPADLDLVYDAWSGRWIEAFRLCLGSPLPCMCHWRLSSGHADWLPTVSLASLFPAYKGIRFHDGSSCVSGGWRDQQFDQRAQQRFAPLSYIVNELEEPQVKG